MDGSRYRRFTDELVERLDADDRVIGVVALGSTAATSHPPDTWSDHDVWIVTRDGAAADLRSDVSWLPEASRIVLLVPETLHGRSVIYDDGHLVEFAVFDDAELEVARANSFRVLLDRCDLRRRMEEIAERTSIAAGTPAVDELGTLLSQITIGVNRFARGERLSAGQLVRCHAARTLIGLLAGAGERAASGRLDTLDPTRRFEQVDPDVAGEVGSALDGSILDAASALLDVAERELPSRVDAAAFRAVRATVSRAAAHVG